MQKSRKFRVFLFAALISSLLGFGKTALAGDIILKDLAGQSLNLSSYKGKPAILFFWTTWCPYCRVELRQLNQLYPQISQEGIAVFGVNISERESKVKNFFKGYQLNFRVLLDQNGLLADHYNLMGVPTYIFLDKSGKLISRANRLPDNYKRLLFQE